MSKVIQHTHHDTASGKTIDIFDNLYNFEKHYQIMKWAIKQPYSFDMGFDAVITEQASKLVCRSTVNIDKKEYLHRFELDQVPPIWNRIKDKELSRSWINVLTPHHVPRMHPDNFKPGSVTILYYINMKWDPDWDGYTVWRTEDLSSIEFMADFVPGRIAMFDSNIPHKATVPSLDAPAFRFTLNSVWE